MIVWVVIAGFLLWLAAMGLSVESCIQERDEMDRPAAPAHAPRCGARADPLCVVSRMTDMARTITITTTVTRTIGQIAHEATDPSVPWSKLTPIERDRWEAIAEAVADPTPSAPRPRPRPPDPADTRPAATASGVARRDRPSTRTKGMAAAPGYSPHGDPPMSAVVSSAGGETAAEFQSNGSITFATTGDISGPRRALEQPGRKR